jgi:hypothetical protein
MCFSSLAAANLDFRLPVRKDDIHISVIKFIEPNNIGVAVGITLLPHLEVEICLGVFTPSHPVRGVRCCFSFKGQRLFDSPHC